MRGHLSRSAMKTSLKLSCLSVLFFVLLEATALASVCAEGVPNGSLQVQLEFLIACEPAAGPSSLGSQAKQEGNGSPRSSNLSAGPSEKKAAFGLRASGESGGGRQNAAAGGGSGTSANGAGSGGAGSGGAGSGGNAGGTGGGTATGSDTGGDHGRPASHGNNGLGNGGGDGSPNGRDDQGR